MDGTLAYILTDCEGGDPVSAPGRWQRAPDDSRSGLTA